MVAGHSQQQPSSKWVKPQSAAALHARSRLGRTGALASPAPEHKPKSSSTTPIRMNLIVAADAPIFLAGKGGTYMGLNATRKPTEVSRVDCAQVTERLAAFAEGDVVAPDRPAILAHCAQCEACGAILAKARKRLGAPAGQPSPARTTRSAARVQRPMW